MEQLLDKIKAHPLFNQQLTHPDGLETLLKTALEKDFGESNQQGIEYLEKYLQRLICIRSRRILSPLDFGSFAPGLYFLNDLPSMQIYQKCKLFRLCYHTYKAKFSMLDTGLSLDDGIITNSVALQKPVRFCSKLATRH
eukprot:Gregarina_sp_Poly_1__4667@NODE_2494_length_2063_cov_7_575150_g1584_i0_p1_GENE_NODE_2494_length_2063_cov_7_575150_g1584_i0NODE_2494_length_2063_cov_7_575150_g1584_i0_p1_ORF_typecomplete_len139_score12_43_NODE_2494_length_2063_cov_7_575150_g1584_i06831099